MKSGKVEYANELLTAESESRRCAWQRIVSNSRDLIMNHESSSWSSVARVVSWVMYRLMSLERGRRKRRLELSLAGICELEMLKQRHETLITRALALHAPDSPIRAHDDCSPGRPPVRRPFQSLCSVNRSDSDFIHESEVRKRFLNSWLFSSLLSVTVRRLNAWI